MKKILMVLVVGVGLVACGDNTGGSSNSGSESGTGGTIDSNVTAPGGGMTNDNPTLQSDTSLVDTTTSGGRSGGSGDGSGSGSGSGAAQ